MKFDAYEYTGVILPGAVVVLSTCLLFPELKELLGKDGISLGGLGVFVIASFVVGHVVQALGNIIERVGIGVYKPSGTDALLSPTQSIVAPAQRERLKETLTQRGSGDLDELTPHAWRAVRREMYAEVRAKKATERIDAFNRTYGLQRGIAAGFLLAAATIVIVAFPRWPIALMLFCAAFLALLRMRRFSDHYMAELVVEYLRADSTKSASEKSK
ncbi:hypothetical protein [Bosea sp. CS1GBMeth4]|uniref:hypothetical protein n=1 Tax=Bosea sp. CS1GBMeth4 TaxID=1892849 RepID=UPI0016446F42|nr:hypothetical protein [Bosea sp. CS1GBMeth4]